MNDIKLKPCPFCGGEAALIENGFYNSCLVKCTKCGAETSEVEGVGFYILGFEAAEKWNKRVGEKE